jgi:hypothetical protein
MISELDLTMQQLQAVGCFSLGNPEIADGLDADKAYEIRTDRILPVDGAGFIDVVCRFVYTLRAVNITLRSV